jgi:sulfite exporter TauE/SafE
VNLETATALAAVGAGLATSLHCIGMCGPLACALKVRPLEYHGSRLISYTITGGLAGAIGDPLVDLFKGEAARVVP